MSSEKQPPSSANQKEKRKIHKNIPQLLFNLIQAAISVLIWARGTGKTDGPVADFSLNNVLKMPRSNGAVYCNTYTDILQKVLPGMVRGWARNGYIEGIHFWVRSYAPAEYKIPKAFRHPLIATHYIQWFNGSGMFLVSGDRSTSNGFDLDWAVVEEARLQNRDKLREFLLTIRGNDHHFGHLAEHGSVLYVTDMPQHSKEKWVLDFRKQMNEENIELILAIQMKLIKLKEKFRQGSESTRAKIQTEINYFEKHLNELRKDTVYFSMASTLDNVHAIGLKPILNYKRNLSDLEYSVSVLNHEIEKIENGFYGLLDPDLHEYTSENYEVIDSLKDPSVENRTCLWQNDIHVDQPLHIAFDHNQVINNVVTGQPQGRVFRSLNHHYVLGENKEYLAELCEKWCRFHKGHLNKHVYYYFDNTSVGGDARGSVPFNEEVVTILTQNGWNVSSIYLGQASHHHSRHYLWELGFLGNDTRIQQPMFNSITCPWLLKSLKQAPVTKVGDSYKKDKSSEKPDKNGKYLVDPRVATHASEAMDTLYWGTQRHEIDHLPPMTDNIY